MPEADRRAARAEGYRLADAILKANRDTVPRIADELQERACGEGDVVRIEGDELSALFAGENEQRDG